MVRKKVLAAKRPITKGKKTAARGLAVSHDALYAEALRRGVEVVNGAESLLGSYGHWLFANVFEGNTAAVLDGEIEHPIWAKLTEAADGATLPISRRTLSVVLRVAALDKRLADASWSALGFTLKSELLPLNDPKLLRTAARHVLAGGLSTRATRTYVATLLHPEGAIVRLTPVKARSAVKRLSTQFAKPKYLSKLESALNKLDDAELSTARAKLLEVAKQLQELAKSLRAPERK
jgi:hypothetical protein